MQEVKLIKDFGIRALMAVIAGAGLYGLLFYIVITKELEPTTLLALIAVAQAPFLTALAFYFGERKAKKEDA